MSWGVFADHGENTAVVIGVGMNVEEIFPDCICKCIDDQLVATLTDIDNTFEHSFGLSTRGVHRHPRW